MFEKLITGGISTKSKSLTGRNVTEKEGSRNFFRSPLNDQVDVRTQFECSIVLQGSELCICSYGLLGLKEEINDRGKSLTQL